MSGYVIVKTEIGKKIYKLLRATTHTMILCQIGVHNALEVEKPKKDLLFSSLDLQECYDNLTRH